MNRRPPIDARLAGPCGRARIVLAAGRSLADAVDAALAPLRWPSATLLILGGSMARAFFHTSVLTPDGPRWIDYGPARELPSPSWLVMASATYGRALDGGPALHCHAVFAAASGPVGGHLPPERCVVGPDGLVAHAVAGPHAQFRVHSDPATGFQLLAPE